MNKRIDHFEEKQKLENKTFTEALDSKISKKGFDKLAMRMDYIFDKNKKHIKFTCFVGLKTTRHGRLKSNQKLLLMIFCLMRFKQT